MSVCGHDCRIAAVVLVGILVRILKVILGPRRLSCCIHGLTGSGSRLLSGLGRGLGTAIAWSLLAIASDTSVGTGAAAIVSRSAAIVGRSATVA